VPATLLHRAQRAQSSDWTRKAWIAILCRPLRCMSHPDNALDGIQIVMRRLMHCSDR